MNDPLHILSLFFHILATLTWASGLIFMTALLRPGVRALLKDGDGLLGSVRKRYYALTNLSLFVLIATGLYQMGKSPFYEGLLAITNPWSWAMLAKHIAVIGVVGVGAVMQFGLFPALDRAALLAAKGKTGKVNLPNIPDAAVLGRRERRLMNLNAALAVIVLLCTAIATAA